MTLCSLCQSIPFTNLPELPAPWNKGHELSGIDNFERFYPVFHHAGQLERGAPLGFPHQSSLEALSASAVTCELCNLVHESAGLFVAAYQKAEQETYFFTPEEKNSGIPVDLPLWLTRRLDGGDGFLAFTYSQTGTTIFLVGAIGFCAQNDAPMASFFRGRPVEADAQSETTLSRAKGWADECLGRHENCHSNNNKSLPSRVLDLDCHSDPGEIKLWETGAAHGRYATLSHCWGSSGHFTTTRATMAARKQGIELSELPKNFLDAVTVARKLSIRYLWIDALCICQDDAQDWEREAAKMAAIYSNSCLTIAADCAGNTSDGFLTRTLERQHIPLNFTMGNGISGQILAFRLPLPRAAWNLCYIMMADQPLTTRAWALQERAMAQRILHFSSDQMYFECNQTFCSEDGLYIQGRNNSLFVSPEPGFIPWQRQSRHSQDHTLWNGILEDYTSRKLSRVSDKLPALSGLARLFSERMNAKYVAGMWSNAIVEGLAWQSLGDDIAMKPDYIAPSWSWASYNGIAATGGSGLRDLAIVIDYSISLKGTNEYGEVTDGWIKLRAPLIPLSISDVKEDSHPMTRRRTRLKTLWGDKSGEIACFDTIEAHNEYTVLNPLPLFALVLASALDRDQEGFGYEALIVTAENGNETRMRRLGFISLDERTLGNTQVVADPAQFTVVTLI